MPLKSFLLHTEWVHISQLLVPLGVLLIRTLALVLPLDLSRGLVPIGQAQGSIGPLHGAWVDVCGSTVDGCGTGLARPHCVDGVLQTSPRGT